MEGFGVQTPPPYCSPQEDYTTEEEEGGAGGSAAGILDLLKASRQVGGSEYPQLR